MLDAENRAVMAVGLVAAIDNSLRWAAQLQRACDAVPELKRYALLSQFLPRRATDDAPRWARLVIQYACDIEALGVDSMQLLQHLYRGWTPLPDTFGFGVFDHAAAERELALKRSLRGALG